MLACYSFHFLDTQHDEAAQVMLRESLSNLSTQCSNEAIKKAISATILTKSRVPFGKRAKTVDQSLKSNEPREAVKKTKLDELRTSFLSLYVEDALKFYKEYREENRKNQDKIDKCYRIRATCHLALGNYTQALSLAQKGNIFDIAFISSIVEQQYDVAEKMIPLAIRTINSVTKVPDSSVSMYELIILTTVVVLATSTTGKAENQLANLFTATNYEFPLLVKLRDAFIDRKFKDFLRLLKQLRPILEVSLYTAHVVKPIINAIKLNAIFNCVQVFAEITFNEIFDQTGVKQSKILGFLLTLIRSGKLNGKIDMVQQKFIGGICDLQYKENVNFLDRVTTVKDNYLLNQFIQEYNKTKKPK
ncbi:hypothetical protein GPJ56_004760 [Histomonas meleagridis]|uniref:uncharacterized protein n=1 Tax=Histomonas meleagridis TaxID=135588 RepID=UPI00355A65CB|nr:hypothetical protein GPJ56_004760 [Histomonas meleagridis]KAH0801658.1 hypothetical protein GO595_005493 [Histomonas meleagridis]